MILRGTDLKQMFLDIARIWMENNEYLSEIDSKFGDGDHGITIKKIAVFMEQRANEWLGDDIFDFIDGLSDGIMAIRGGSAGPLYGTMIGGLSGSLTGVTEINGIILKRMFSDSLSAMQEITTADVGDKTMMDALIPAVVAAQTAGDEPFEILKAAGKAAAKGAKDSEQYVSKFGRAKSYKEQTIGTPDAGAVSTALFFEGLAKIGDR